MALAFIVLAFNSLKIFIFDRVLFYALEHTSYYLPDHMPDYVPDRVPDYFVYSSFQRIYLLYHFQPLTLYTLAIICYLIGRSRARSHAGGLSVISGSKSHGAVCKGNAYCAAGGRLQSNQSLTLTATTFRRMPAIIRNENGNLVITGCCIMHASIGGGAGACVRLGW